MLYCNLHVEIYFPSCRVATFHARVLWDYYMDSLKVNDNIITIDMAVKNDDDFESRLTDLLAPHMLSGQVMLVEVLGFTQDKYTRVARLLAGIPGRHTIMGHTEQHRSWLAATYTHND